jgi:hypothetical protein
VFPTMVEELGEVCALPRRLLWRGLGFCTSKPINVFLLTKGSILFEHTTYDMIWYNIIVEWFSLDLYRFTIQQLNPHCRVTIQIVIIIPFVWNIRTSQVITILS